MTPARTPSRNASAPVHRPPAAGSGSDDPFRQAVLLVLLAAVAAVAMPLRAAEPGPQRERPSGQPQAVGAVHTVRNIPEACTRLEGMFTGDAAAPYRLQAVPVGGNCQPRAGWLEAGQVRPAEPDGWIYDDRIRIPAAACPSQQAVVQVWRKPVAQPLARDGQGQVRIYLDEARKQAAAGQMRPLPQFTARLELEGPPCR